MATIQTTGRTAERNRFNVTGPPEEAQKVRDTPGPGKKDRMRQQAASKQDSKRKKRTSDRGVKKA